MNELETTVQVEKNKTNMNDGQTNDDYFNVSNGLFVLRKNNMSRLEWQVTT